MVDYFLTVMALVAWTVTISKFKPAYRVWRQHDPARTDAGVQASWAFALLFSLYLTLKIQAVAVMVDALVQMDHMAHFLAFVSQTWAIYFIILNCCIVLQLRQPRWLPMAPLLATALFFLLFQFGFSADRVPPGSPSRDSLVALWFNLTMYVYAVLVLSVPLPAYFRYSRTERVPTLRLRTTFMLTSILSAIMLAVVRGATSVWGYLDANAATFMPLVDGLALTLYVMATGMWAALFLPNRCYEALVKPLVFLDKLATLYDLSPLERRLRQITPPIVPDHSGWWEWLRHPDYCIYCKMINILDGQKVLNGTMRSLTGPEPAPVYPNLPFSFQSTVDHTPVLDIASHQVMRLNQLLQASPRDSDYADLVWHYRQVGRALRGGVQPAPVFGEAVHG